MSHDDSRDNSSDNADGGRASSEPHLPQTSGRRDALNRRRTEAYQFSISLAVSGDKDAVRRVADAELELHTHPRRRTPFREGPWVLIVGFAAMILFGAILLKLPWSAAPGTQITWEEALFTSTSATTVTGLAVRNTANDFSFFGQLVILFLLQVGGVGFIAFSVLLFRLIGRRITLQTRFIVQQSLGQQGASGVLNLALYVLGITLAIEAVGALFLWLRWRTTMPDSQALWYAVFHAISSYCNAGFDLFSGTDQGMLFGYGTDWFTLTVMGALITVGGFGITILYDLWSFRADRNLSINTRITIVLTFLLTLVGFIIFMADASLHANVMSGTTMSERSAVGLFTVVSARTAGLTIVPLEKLNEATQMMVLLWMFVGGAPASMAGGVTLSTVGVLMVSVLATVRGLDSASAFGRTIPFETIAKAVAVMTVSTLLVTALTLALSLRHEGEIFAVAFEVVSAFANAGYSLDFTSHLDGVGRFIIAFAMFWGRLGPLTIVVALAQRQQPTLIQFPEEPVILG
jgi:trk system potassium uptake protein TrkH